MYLWFFVSFVSTLTRQRPNSFRVSQVLRCKTSRSLFGPKRELDEWRKRHLSSDTNEKVKLLSLIQQRKKKSTNAYIVLEGHRAILDALSTGLVPEDVLISERALDAPLGQRLFDALQPHSSVVSTAADKVISKIADTVSNQGVVAMFKLKVAQLPTTCSLIVICDGISDPGNLGTIIRTAYGFGADAVVTVGGVDPWSSKVLRSAMGMSLRLPVMTMDWTELAQVVQEKNLDVLLADASADAASIYDTAPSASCALVIGSEGFGISHQAGALTAARRVYIPMARPLESLNAASAAAILLAEISRHQPTSKI